MNNNFNKPTRVGDTIKTRPYKKNVTNVKKDILNNVNNVKPGNGDLELLLDEYSRKPEAFAEMIAEKLNDMGSINFYTRICKINKPETILDYVSIVLDWERDGQIRKSKGAAFTWLLKKKGVSLY